MRDGSIAMVGTYTNNEFEIQSMVFELPIFVVVLLFLTISTDW